MNVHDVLSRHKQKYSQGSINRFDALVRGMMLSVDNAQRKRLEMRLIFQLGTSQPRGLNSDFRFL